MEKAHRVNLHEGTEYVRKILQQEYWIIGLSNALRKIESSCIKCRHKNVNPIHPPMADLPRERLNEHVFPFTHTGVDYFGPIELKFLRHTLKRWSCLFTCLTTRALHIKVAQSLDTESFLAAEKASAPFMPSSDRYHDLRKPFETAQAYADMIWKNGHVNIFHNGIRDQSGQKNMYEI